MHEILACIEENAMYFLEDNAEVKREEKIMPKRKKIEAGNRGVGFEFESIPLPSDRRPRLRSWRNRSEGKGFELGSL